MDPSLLPVANEIASQQAAPTQTVLKAANRLLSYCSGHRTGSITFHACDMCLHGFSDASYLSRSHARSVAGAYLYLFLGNFNKPTQINGPIHVFYTIIPCIVAASAKRNTQHSSHSDNKQPHYEPYFTRWDTRSSPQYYCATTPLLSV